MPNFNFKQLLIVQLSYLFLLVTHVFAVELIDWSEYNNIPQVGAFTLIEGGVNKVIDFETIDGNKDGIKDLAMIRTNMNENNKTFVKEATPFRDYISLGGLIDFGESKSYQRLNLISEISPYHFFTFRITQELGIVDFYNEKFEKIDSIVTVTMKDFNNNGSINTYISVFDFYDINHDLRKDFIMTINSGGDGQPRCLLAYDLYSKKCLIKKLFAPQCIYLVVTDFESDDNLELIVTLGGASDGPFFGEFDRHGTFLVILDNKGNIIKSFDYSGPASYVYPVVNDFTGDQIEDIAVSYQCYSKRGNSYSKLEIIDGSNFTKLDSIVVKSDPLFFVKLVSKDFNSDRVYEILSYLGKEIVNISEYHIDLQKLELKYQAIAGDRPVYVLDEDLNRDGKQELFFITLNPSCIWITDHTLEPLAKIPIEKFDSFLPKLVKLKSDQNSVFEYMLLNNQELFKLVIDKNTVFPESFLQIQKMGHQFKITLFPIVLVFSGLVIIGVYGLFYKKSALSLTTLQHSQRIGMLGITKSRKIVSGNFIFFEKFGFDPDKMLNAQIDQIFAENELFILVSLFDRFVKNDLMTFQKEIQLSALSQKMNLAIEIYQSTNRQHDNIFQIFLIDLTETTFSERLKLWSAMAQRVAHKSKTPLSTIMLVIQRMQREMSKEEPNVEQFKKLSNSALDEINKVRDNINLFMKVSKLNEPSYTVSDLNNTIQKLLADYRNRLPESVTLIEDYEQEELNVKIDIGQFQEAFYNILDNAIIAINNQGAVSLTTLKESHPLNDYGVNEFAVIEIADNGKGISSEILAKLFNPGFTTYNQGSGMGLVIAKSIIEAHGGSIDIQSKHEFGTTVSFHLPIMKVGGNHESE